MQVNPIVVEDLSKQYIVSAVKRRRHDTLQDHVADSLRSLFRRDRQRQRNQTFWALKRVSFEVGHGEVVGLIGSNGAGKSTLLKILSRITEPTGGCAAIEGRVASLLEVGTGFQPELSGRENVYLSGAILGMRRSEITRKFDEIVDFSGVETFIDTPVKRYSSGMYVRLAFAVAAHLEPEIMFVDEVLAVGDAAFQQKCLGKMQDSVGQGRTVVFVSHNMAAVLNLCPRSIWLRGGEIVADGPTEDVVSRYLQSLDTHKDTCVADRTDRKGNQAVKFVDIELRNGSGTPVQRVQCGDRMTIALSFECARGGLDHVYVGVGVHGKFDENLFDMTTDLSGLRFNALPRQGTFLCAVPRVPLIPGRYSFNVYCEAGGELADWVLNAGCIEVEPGDFFESGKLPHSDQGPFLVDHSWSMVGTTASR